MSEGAARALVAGHGDFAAGMVSAVEQITGRGDVFLAVSNRALGADDIERVLREQLDATGATMIFTDLPAGSCTIAARRLLRTRRELVLLTGTSLASLLDFVFHVDLPVTDAARHAAEKARSAVLVLGGGGQISGD